MLGELLPQGGGDPIPLLKPKLLIGRRDSCDIALRFPNVSSHHCELEFLNGFWHIRDLGSSNGIKVNGARVDSKWLLSGDELSIAKHHYTISYVQMADAPPPSDEDGPELSLLEKAGLARRKSDEPAAPRRGTVDPGEVTQLDQPSSLNRRNSSSNNKSKKPLSDEERALEWLQDDEHRPG